ncbi:MULTISPECIES: hypothetical protein [unclassified Halomonas]|uniref:hypothetical protein n=1 Tax=unclassified Halomonas TaxID=2609666 RepID=UPI00207675AC|nr:MULTISPECIES: hypothetical protein [unclassified Halomonas]
MLIFTSDPIASGVTQEFTAYSQPFFIVLSGQFAPSASSSSYGTAQVQCLAESGEWVDVAGHAYRMPAVDSFMIPPGAKARVQVERTGGVTVEIHDSDPTEVPA